MSKPINRILIKSPDSLSELILFSPVLNLIKKHYPNVHITLVVNKNGREVFYSSPYVDEMWTIDSKFFGWKYYLLMRRQWQKKKFDAYLFFGGSVMSNVLAWMKRVPLRVGRARYWSSRIFLNRVIFQDRNMVDMHETEYNLNLLEPIGIQYDVSLRDQLETKITVDKTSADESFQKFKDKVKKSDVELRSEFFFVHPGASNLHPVWSEKNFIKLFNKTEARFPGRFTYIVAHTKKEKKQIASMKKFIQRDKYKSLMNKTYFFNGEDDGLRNYMEVLSNANIYVGMTTGSFYLADGIGVKTVGLYLPIKSVSPFRWRPFHQDMTRSSEILPEVVCGETLRCSLTKCPYYDCMARVEVDWVMSESLSLIDTKLKLKEKEMV